MAKLTKYGSLTPPASTTSAPTCLSTPTPPHKFLLVSDLSSFAMRGLSQTTCGKIDCFPLCVEGIPAETTLPDFLSAFFEGMQSEIIATSAIEKGRLTLCLGDQTSRRDVWTMLHTSIPPIPFKVSCPAKAPLFSPEKAAPPSDKPLI